MQWLHLIAADLTLCIAVRYFADDPCSPQFRSLGAAELWPGPGRQHLKVTQPGRLSVASSNPIGCTTPYACTLEATFNMGYPFWSTLDAYRSARLHGHHESMSFPPATHATR